MIMYLYKKCSMYEVMNCTPVAGLHFQIYSLHI